MKMKNKEADQNDRRKRHKAEISAAKKRKRGEPTFELDENYNEERQRILIVCEGENTEPSYFRQFRLTSGQIVAVGAGCETIRVVERAEEESRKEQYDQIWVVFDKDDFDAQDFNAAIVRAKNNGFGVAYSNQAFEYWLVLHFDDHQGGGMHRDEYEGKINEHLLKYGLFYDGKESKIVTEGIFDLLLAYEPKSNTRRIHLAIRRAKRIFDSYDHYSPAKEESSTAVFLLVEEILKNINI